MKSCDPELDEVVFVAVSSGFICGHPAVDVVGATADNSALGTSGRVTALAVDPRSDNTVYLGASEGGIWKTTNGGATWTYLPGSFAGVRGPLSPCAGGTFISALASHPSNAQTVLAAVRFGSCDISATAGGTPNLDGIYRSTDFGAY